MPSQEKIASFYLPLFMSFIIALNISLSMFDIKLCENSGCNVVGDFLNIDQLILNMAGLLFFTSIIMLSHRIKLITFIIFYAFLFETFLICYQLFVLHTICFYCLSIYASLVILMILRGKLDDLLVIFITLSIAFNVVKFVPLNETNTQQESVLFYGSESCKHCKEAKILLKSKNINYQFRDIKKIENVYFLKHLNIKTIPTLVLSNANTKQILVGFDSIKKYYKNGKQNLQMNFNMFGNTTSSIPSKAGCVLK